MRKTIRALTIAPRSMSVGLTPSTVSPARRSMPQPPVSGEPNTLRIGVTIDDTNVSTTAANAVPMTTAIASSTTLPRMMKSLNPLITGPPRCECRCRGSAPPCADEGSGRPSRGQETRGRGAPARGAPERRLSRRGRSAPGRRDRAPRPALGARAVAPGAVVVLPREPAVGPLRGAPAGRPPVTTAPSRRRSGRLGPPLGLGRLGLLLTLGPLGLPLRRGRRSAGRSLGGLLGGPLARGRGGRGALGP